MSCCTIKLGGFKAPSLTHRLKFLESLTLLQSNGQLSPFFVKDGRSGGRFSFSEHGGAAESRKTFRQKNTP
jgi:hypothetical protein